MSLKFYIGLVWGILGAMALGCGEKEPTGPEEEKEPPQTEVIFYDGFEEDLTRWSEDPSFELSDANFFSGKKSLWAATPIAGEVHTKLSFDLRGYSSATLTFWSDLQLVPGVERGSYVSVVLTGHQDGQETNEIIWTNSGEDIDAGWQKISVSLDTYCGRTKNVRFAFNCRGSKGVVRYQGIAGDPTLIAEHDPILSGVDLVNFGVIFNDEEDWQPTSSLFDISVEPNPFTPNGDGINDAVQLQYGLRRVFEPIVVNISIYRDPHTLVLTLVHKMTSGIYRVVWDGRDDSGELVSGGIHRIFIQAGEERTYGDVWVITGSLLEGEVPVFWSGKAVDWYIDDMKLSAVPK